jgi:recombination associated protein RdgC
MFKNAIVYRIDQWPAPAPSVAHLEAQLDGSRFVACGTTQQESIGWVEPRGEAHGALIESVAGQWILRLCVETKSVPSAVVRAELETQLAKLEQDTGHRPKGKAAREIKEGIVHTLLPRAFPKQSFTWVWFDIANKRVWIAAASAKKADTIVTRLVDLMGGALRLTQLQTQLSPATAMAAWLTEKEAPGPFSLDRECELKQGDGEKSAVRYARHSLDINELGEHIRQGKLPTQLAMTWAGRVSFVLTEMLALKKIKLLDGVIEGQNNNNGKADSGFDTDVAISTGELSKLITNLVDALDGELDSETAAANLSASVAVPNTKSPAGSASLSSTPVTPSPADSAANSPPWAVAAA